MIPLLGKGLPVLALHYVIHQMCSQNKKINKYFYWSKFWILFFTYNMLLHKEKNIFINNLNISVPLGFKITHVMSKLVFHIQESPKFPRWCSNWECNLPLSSLFHFDFQRGYCN